MSGEIILENGAPVYTDCQSGRHVKLKPSSPLDWGSETTQRGSLTLERLAQDFLASPPLFERSILL